MTVIAMQQPKILKNQEIDEQEIMIQSFAMDHPGVEISGAFQFSSQSFETACDVLKYTYIIDDNLRIDILDDEDRLNKGFKPVVSRDILATYKTLLYRAACIAQDINDQLQTYKRISWVLSGAVLVIWLYASLTSTVSH